MCEVLYLTMTFENKCGYPLTTILIIDVFVP